MRPFLGKVGGGQVDRDLFRWKRQAGSMQGRLHPFPALGNGLVRQADTVHFNLAGADHDLNFDRQAFYALECNRTDSCHHATAPNLMSAAPSINAICQSAEHTSELHSL